MKGVAELSAEERSELFKETAIRKGITSAAVEKDFWICWVLMKIYTHPRLSRVLRFKGGTSLSKCFGVIERFSEDIDLILDWTELTQVDLTQELSNTKQSKLNDEINSQARDFIKQELLPLIQIEVEGYCLAEIDEDDAHTVNVSYQSSFPNHYLRDQIRLEIGPLAEMVPFGRYSVKPYAAEEFSKLFKQPSIELDAIKPERTFWEKVTILHAEAHRPDNRPQPSRYSRHYYDVYRMLGTEIEQAALENLDLLEDVVRFKKKFYYSAWANYDLAILPTIRLVPGGKVLTRLEADYAEMREMIFGDYPLFGDIMSAISVFETRLNQL
ncbi:MAG: nucleotidyl transferase AbiEii/AbiGii toxin family protein [Methyloprofundus sp.]|nr:nucleotidyl transferase AbiEii/AbiGii toxin family protein [Methyloprofundus sp.]